MNSRQMTLHSRLKLGLPLLCTKTWPFESFGRKWVNHQFWSPQMILVPNCKYVLFSKQVCFFKSDKNWGAHSLWRALLSPGALCHFALIKVFFRKRQKNVPTLWKICFWVSKHGSRCQKMLWVDHFAKFKKRKFCQ